MDSYSSKITNSSVRVGNSMDGQECWIKSNVNTIMINVDALLFRSENRYAYRLVARDYRGTLLEAGKLSAELAEAVDFKETLS